MQVLCIDIPQILVSQIIFPSTDFRLKRCCQPESTCYLYSFYKLFDYGWQLHCKICSSVCLWHRCGKTKHQRTSLTCICSYTHRLHYALYANPGGNIFDWQQTVEATICRRRTSGKTWCSQLQRAAPIKDLDSEHRLTFLPFGTLTWKLSPPVSAFFIISLWLG